MGKDLGEKMGNVAIGLLQGEANGRWIGTGTDLVAESAIGEDGGTEGRVQRGGDPWRD